MKKICGIIVFNLLMMSLTAAAQQRVALVIGNAAYVDPLPPLESPVNDARDMAALLKTFGFAVSVQTDVDLQQMVEATQAFGEQLTDRSVAVFYFSGHGVQANNLNYLVPLRARLRAEADAPYEAFDMNRVLTYMEQANANGVNVVIMDACRAATLKGLKGWKQKKIGFAQVTLPEGVSGTLLAYATAPGAASLEREGERNSIYTKHLLNALRDMPSLSLTDLLIDVRKAVKEDTGGEQVPWEAISLTERFAFAEGDATPEPTKKPTKKPTERPRSCWENETAGAECREEATGMEFVFVPGGCFQMGSPKSEDGRYDDEGPQHKVCLDGFWMGKYEVTNAQYRRFKPDHKNYEYEGKSLNGDDQPVVMVSWNDAHAFTAWMAKQGRGEFRLPTEAEWEYAARAGTTTARYWGDNPDDACNYANVGDQTAKKIWTNWTIHDCNDDYAVTAPVGQFEPNAFGLYDMLGNVWEWCQDTYYENYNGAPTDGSAWGSLGDKKANMLLRGGSWLNEPYDVRSANRSRLEPGNQNSVIGIRVVRVR